MFKNIFDIDYCMATCVPIYNLVNKYLKLSHIPISMKMSRLVEITFLQWL